MGCMLSRSMQKRMTIEDYKRNLKGVNDGGNFSDEYLVSRTQCHVDYFIDF